MDKEASDLLRMALLGLLTGGGAYGAMRLGHDIPRAAEKPQKPKDELELTLPAARIPKTAAESHFMDYLGPTLAYGGGAAGGFLGASKLYEMYKKKQLEEKMKMTEEDYIKALQAAHTKVGSANTPLVDKFLEGLITKAGEELQKEGYFGADMPATGPFESIGHAGQGLAESASKTPLGSAAIAAWLMAAMGSGGATYWLGKQMDKQKKQNAQQTTLPSEIKLNVV